MVALDIWEMGRRGGETKGGRENGVLEARIYHLLFLYYLALEDELRWQASMLYIRFKL